MVGRLFATSAPSSIVGLHLVEVKVGTLHREASSLYVAMLSLFFLDGLADGHSYGIAFLRDEEAATSCTM